MQIKHNVMNHVILLLGMLPNIEAFIDMLLRILVSVQANLIREAAVSYLLDSGVHWGSAPAVKVRL